jgi:hypothetical protein
VGVQLGHGAYTCENLFTFYVLRSQTMCLRYLCLPCRHCLCQGFSFLNHNSTVVRCCSYNSSSLCNKHIFLNTLYQPIHQQHFYFLHNGKQNATIDSSPKKTPTFNYAIKKTGTWNWINPDIAELVIPRVSEYFHMWS